jgi:transposase-like protein
VEVERKIPLEFKEVCVTMDTTYFGRGLGVMVFRDTYHKNNLYWKYVSHETLKEYIDGIIWLQSRGFNIKAIVCDGKRGLFTAFNNIPVQMCQFHQAAIVTRYITKTPQHPCGQKLQDLMRLLPKTDKESFEGAFMDWLSKWKTFLNEITINPETGKKHYTHKRLRSAARSIKSNLPFLFTWYDYQDLKIPCTTNAIEGVFSAIKIKIRVHAGLKKTS